VAVSAALPLEGGMPPVVLGFTHKADCADSYCTSLPQSGSVRLSYSNLTLSNSGDVLHLAFETKCISTIPQPPKTRNATIYEVLAKSDNVIVLFKMNLTNFWTRFSGGNFVALFT